MIDYVEARARQRERAAECIAIAAASGDPAEVIAFSLLAIARLMYLRETAPDSTANCDNRPREAQ